MQNEKLFAMRHSAAHVLAAAIKKLYPEAQFGVGPVVEHGFYYDIKTKEPITEADLKGIEKEMKHLVKQNHEMIREEMTIPEAIELFTEMDQPFKVELLDALATKGSTKISEEESMDIEAGATTATVYKTGDFIDLCRGPHIAKLKEIGPFKLMKVAGAYWRGNQDNEQLTRIYGVCFETKEELKAHITMLDEAKKRDHRKLGQELDLFTFSELVGPGFPLFTSRGTIMRDQLTAFVWELMKPYGYERVHIPHLAKSDLYKKSGHWDKFEDDIFHVRSKKTDSEFVMKPMNCPHHTQIFASRPRSYRDLPIRMSEVTSVYRDENTGQLQGLTRVRSITQDDAHVFCRVDQIRDEVMALYDIITKFYQAFDMSLRMRLSVNDPDEPEKYLGGEEVWEESVGALRAMLEDLGKEYEVGVGEAAFYGPKIDFVATDAIGREWQLATIQLDFVQPERFELEYINEEGEKERPVMIHRAVLGSVERFMGVMIEHYAGAFPMWLAPEQIRLAPVSDQYIPFTEELAQKLRAADLRVQIDTSTEGVGKKVRNAAMMKIPWTVVLGEKEVEGGDIQITQFGTQEKREITQADFIKEAVNEAKFPHQR